MPMYDFRCKKCGHKFMVITGMADRDKVTCAKCGAREVEQLISGCSVISGSGSACSTSGRPGGGTGFKGG
ncbi:MAG: FmdB family zinc ribbon protein [Bacillota bacterium]